jgi:hypothetical protein
MVAVTYGVARVAAPAVADTKAAKKGKGFFARVFDAIAASQMRRVERDLARYRHLLPHDFTLPQDKLKSRSEDQLPFGGW